MIPRFSLFLSENFPFCATKQAPDTFLAKSPADTFLACVGICKRTLQLNALQQKPEAKKLSGNKFPNLFPPISLCEQTAKETGSSTTFKSLINKNGDRRDKRNQLDTVIEPVLESLSLNGKMYVKMRIRLLNQLLFRNGDDVPTHLRQRIAIVKTLMSTNAKTEYQLVEMKARSLFLESYNEENLDEILANADLFYQYLDMEPAPNDLEESSLTLKQYIDQEYSSYEQYLEFQLSLILWREPRKCMQQQVEYHTSKIKSPHLMAGRLMRFSHILSICRLLSSSFCLQVRKAKVRKTLRIGILVSILLNPRNVMRCNTTACQNGSRKILII